MSGPKVQKGGCTRKHAFFAFFTFFDVFLIFSIIFEFILSLFFNIYWLVCLFGLYIYLLVKKFILINGHGFNLRPILTDFVVFWRFLGPPQKPPKSEKGVEMSSVSYGAFLAFLRNTDETRVFWRKVDFWPFLTFFDVFRVFSRNLDFSENRDV